MHISVVLFSLHDSAFNHISELLDAAVHHLQLLTTHTSTITIALVLHGTHFRIWSITGGSNHCSFGNIFCCYRYLIDDKIVDILLFGFYTKGLTSPLWWAHFGNGSGQTYSFSIGVMGRFTEYSWADKFLTKSCPHTLEGWSSSYCFHPKSRTS